MNVKRSSAGWFAHAPAKINLFFEVLARRGDGYHEIETLMVPVDLTDILSFQLDPSGGISLDCRWGTWNGRPLGDEGDAAAWLPPEGENLIVRAAERLRRSANVSAGARFTLCKRIPISSGLGGGSSDAAAALLLANAGWELNWPRERLAELAAELGSDVPFFLWGQAALCRGRGERVEPLAGLRGLHAVLVRPPQGLSTAEVYRRCRPADAPRAAAPLVAALSGGDWRSAAPRVFNRLEEAAGELSPWIARLGDELRAAGCWAARMSGSGSCVFGLCGNAEQARRAAARLRARRWAAVFVVRS